MILSANGLSISFGENNLFKDVSFKINKGDKIGLIGANGVGKTTLFKILTGELSEDSGSVTKQSGITIGYLEQYACGKDDNTVLDEALTVFSDLIKLEGEIEVINNMLLVSSEQDLIDRQHMLTEKFNREGGLTYRSRTKAALLGLGFTEENLLMPTRAMSGGQRSKIGLCKLLLSKPDIMLLDEPTNHLDVTSIEWLEEFIKSYEGAAVIISHDRYFLDIVTNITFEIEHSTFFSFDGNYSRYCQIKKEREKSEKRVYQNTINEVHRIEKIIEQQKRWNREKNIKTAQSKQKQIDRLTKDLKAPEREEERLSFTFKPRKYSGKDVLSAYDLKAEFPDGVLFKNIDLEIKRGERVFILGDNGCGKTTLLKKLVLGEGNIKFGTNVELGYFDQHGDNHDLSKTVFDEVHDAYPNLSGTEVRNALATFLFKGDDYLKVLKNSSGGERARISLLKLMLSGANLLILDEPTNHLDLWSREALERSLDKYEGTLIAVSHDRYFINKLADKILWLKPDGICNINGNYNDYCTIKNSEEEILTHKKEQSENARKYNEEKKKQSDLRKLKAALRKLEGDIDEIESKISENDKLLLDEQVSSDYKKTMEISKENEKLNELLDQKMNEWERVSEELN